MVIKNTKAEIDLEDELRTSAFLKVWSTLMLAREGLVSSPYNDFSLLTESSVLLQ